MMKKSVFTLALVFAWLFFIGCSSDDDNQNQNTSCDTNCAVAVASGEFAATVPASIVGKYTLTFTEINPGGPFSDGDTAMFELTSDNKLVVTFGSQCVTISNPILFAEGTTEANFRDNCVFNVLFGASATNTGAFNEINVGTLAFGFLGQFKE